MWQDRLQNTFKQIKIEMDAFLHHYTYTKTGGKAEAIVFPSQQSEVKEIVDFANANHVPFYVLGNASNVIVTDKGMKGIVIKLDLLKKWHILDETIYCESGLKLIDLSYVAYQESLTGLEFACGIPGSVGGALFMNAGAYGGEMKDIVKTVDVLTKEGDFKTYTLDQLDFSYRHSLMQQTGDMILSTTLALKKGNAKVIKEKMDELTHLRTQKQPLEYPSCGSVFKRPTGYFAGELIQKAGLQGKRIGGIEVSTKHAGFMVNVANGSASDYKALIDFVQKTVKDKFDVMLETEVKFIGE